MEERDGIHLGLSEDFDGLFLVIIFFRHLSFYDYHALYTNSIQCSIIECKLMRIKVDNSVLPSLTHLRLRTDRVQSIRPEPRPDLDLNL